MTTYIVLRRNGSTELTVLGEYIANGPDQAIRALAKNEPGTYVAVPERNWTEKGGDVEAAEPRFVLNERTRHTLTIHRDQTALPDGDSAVSLGDPVEEPNAA